MANPNEQLSADDLLADAGGLGEIPPEEQMEYEDELLDGVDDEEAAQKAWDQQKQAQLNQALEKSIRQEKEIDELKKKCEEAQKVAESTGSGETAQTGQQFQKDWKEKHVEMSRKQVELEATLKKFQLELATLRGQVEKGAKENLAASRKPIVPLFDATQPTFSTNKTATTPSPNSNSLLTCQCERSCVFALPNAPRAKTTSPSQLYRMKSLLERNPELAQSPEKLRLLALESFGDMAVNDLVTVWTVLAECPSILETVKSRPGMIKDFRIARSKVLESHGKMLLAMDPVVLALMPGVRREEVPLAHRIVLATDTTIAQFQGILRTDLHTTVVVVVKFTAVQDEVDVWKTWIQAVPEQINVILVPAPAKQINWEQENQFEMFMGEVEKERPRMARILPGYKLPTWCGFSLLKMGQSQSIDGYWTKVQEVVADSSLAWSSFQFLPGHGDKRESSSSSSSSSNSGSGSAELGKPDGETRKMRRKQEESMKPPHHGQWRQKDSYKPRPY